MKRLLWSIAMLTGLALLSGMLVGCDTDDEFEVDRNGDVEYEIERDDGEIEIEADNGDRDVEID